MIRADTSVWIDYFNGATFCIENNLTLLYNDKDFDPLFITTGNFAGKVLS